MPVLFTVIGYALLTAALIPVWQMVSTAAGLAISQDAPVFTSELKSIYDPAYQLQTPVEEESYIRIEEIDLPTAGTQYGNISCEKIGLNAPLYWDDTLEILRYGAGQNIASFLPGFGRILIIAGHNSTFFNVVQNIETGDVIRIDTNYCPYEYEVQEVKVYDENDLEDLLVDHLGDEEETLYLYTCYPFTAHVGRRTDRMLVTAKRISGYDVRWKASQYER
ncbi:MAG: class D sortase [Clostridia bacterium]|jgi:sortase A|nr:class D sortase [Clostridia bacterium]